MIETIAVGGFAALAAGPRAAPVVLVLHGFPDTPRSFAPLITAVAAAKVSTSNGPDSGDGAYPRNHGATTR
jgi:hypothetical protein